MPNEYLQAVIGPFEQIDWAGAWGVHVGATILVTVAVNLLVRRVLHRLQRKAIDSKAYWDDAVLRAVNKPLALLVLVMGLSVATDIIRHHAELAFSGFFESVRIVGVIVLFAWFLVRLVRAGEESLVAKYEGEGEAYDRTTMDALAKLLRMSVTITATLVILQTVGVSLSGVLAFGGIGGIAIGFAAKDLLANFFGGLMIYLDRPFAVGDWIRSPDREIEGTVEQIGWRQTSIRTFDMRPLYVPNATFANIAVENPSRMFNRRIYETIGIRYDDANKMGPIVSAVENMLRGHEEIDTNRTLMVNFNSFAPSSLDFFVYTFTKTTNWAHYHKVKQDILLEILGIIDSQGAETAFPTSTVRLSGPGRLLPPVTGEVEEDPAKAGAKT